MRRRAWIITASVVVGVLLAVLGGDAAVQAVGAPMPASCPAVAPGDPGYSGLARSGVELVPFAPDDALLCRYNGMNARGGAAAHALVGTARAQGADAAQLAAALDQAQTAPLRGPVSCPMDDDASLDAYFAKGHEHIRVRIATGGCGGAGNGLKRAWLKGDITTRLEQLTGMGG